MDVGREESGYDGPYDAPDDDYGYDGAADEPEWGPADSSAYWRRRFFILCGGVAALGVCAWLFPGAHHPTPHEAAAARASVAAAERQQALPSAALGSSWSTPAPATPTAAPSPSPSPSAAKKTKKNQKISLTYRPPGASSPASAAAAVPSGGACKPADIVLSLFTGQSSYAPGARPSFSVYAVSTASAPCTLPYGAAAVQVLVTRHGQVVWDSTACKPSPAKKVRFSAGVPQVLKLIWNPGAAGPAGCAGSLPAGATGTLDAVALHGSQSSPVRSFKIKR